jgi:hypothetical protein
MKIPTIICERTMFISGYPRHNTGNLEVEVVSFLSLIERWSNGTPIMWEM